MAHDGASVEIATSPDPAAAGRAAISVLVDWWRRLRSVYPEPPRSTSHDAGTALTPAATLARLSTFSGAPAGSFDDVGGGEGRDAVVSYLRAFRDGSISFYEAQRLMSDGYWSRQEAHHGPEYYQIFLYTLGMLAPGDEITTDIFRRAADFVAGEGEHRFRWVQPGTGMFRSLFLGSRHVGDATVNAPDHLRFADLCLKGYRITGEERYRAFAVRYLRRWAVPIAAIPSIPAALAQSGRPLSSESLANDDYLSFVGQLLPVDPQTAAAENLIASGAVGLFLAAWQETGDELFVAAAERLIDAVLPTLGQPAAWQVPAQVRRYRNATGSDRYDAAVGAVTGSAIRRIDRLAIVDGPEREANRFIGDRTDKPDWYDQDGNEPPNPILIGLTAEVTGDDHLWTRAIDQATGYLALALESYGPYHDHGCTAKAFHATARGHGRLDGAGVVTEVLNRYLGFVNPEVV